MSETTTTGHAWTEGRCATCGVEAPRPWAETCQPGDRDVEAVAAAVARAEWDHDQVAQPFRVAPSSRHCVIAAALLPLIREREAAAWERGFASGKSRAMRHMSDEPGLSLDAANPYTGSEDDDE